MIKEIIKWLLCCLIIFTISIGMVLLIYLITNYSIISLFVLLSIIMGTSLYLDCFKKEK